MIGTIRKLFFLLKFGSLWEVSIQMQTSYLAISWNQQQIFDFCTSKFMKFFNADADGHNEVSNLELFEQKRKENLLVNLAMIQI